MRRRGSYLVLSLLTAAALLLPYKSLLDGATRVRIEGRGMTTSCGEGGTPVAGHMEVGYLEGNIFGLSIPYPESYFNQVLIAYPDSNPSAIGGSASVDISTRGGANYIKTAGWSPGTWKFADRSSIQASIDVNSTRVGDEVGASVPNLLVARFCYEGNPNAFQERYLVDHSVKIRYGEEPTPDKSLNVVLYQR